MIPHNDSIMQEFCDRFNDKPAIGTIRNAITELVKEKIFLKYGGSSYQLNPQIFWSDGKNERVENILNGFCLNQLYVYAGPVVHQMVTQAGFAPIYLQPMDFHQLYQQQQQKVIL
jgi:hypothetical protein